MNGRSYPVALVVPYLAIFSFKAATDPLKAGSDKPLENIRLK